MAVGKQEDDSKDNAITSNMTNLGAVAARALHGGGNGDGGGENSRGASVLSFTVPRGAEDALVAFCRRIEAGEARRQYGDALRVDLLALRLLEQQRWSSSACGR